MLKVPGEQSAGEWKRGVAGRADLWPCLAGHLCVFASPSPKASRFLSGVSMLSAKSLKTGESKENIHKSAWGYSGVRR